jgi:rSAM/selenodomain-associated transferase 1
MAENRCLIMFVKYPEKGRAKSRLAADIGEEIALNLYKDFVEDTTASLKQGEYSFRICFYPPDAHDRIIEWLGPGYSIMPQRGEDLGERMRSAFADSFSEGFSEALIIGSDCPDLPKEIIDKAFAALSSHDAVLGPSLDGGYYLIGFKKDSFLPEVFSGIQWSTNKVFEQTIAILNNRRKIYILPERRDVDTIEDLRDLFERNKDTAFAASKTMTYLRGIEKENLLPFPNSDSAQTLPP